MTRSIISTVFGIIVVSSIQLFSASAANAQFYYSMDTGVLFLAPGQTLRVSASGTGSETVTVKFKKMEYVESGITDGVLRQQVASQSTTGSLPLAGDQSLVFNAVASGAGVRVQLHSSSPNVNVIASVITPGIGGTAANEQVYFRHQTREYSLVLTFFDQAANDPIVLFFRNAEADHPRPATLLHQTSRRRNNRRKSPRHPPSCPYHFGGNAMIRRITTFALGLFVLSALYSNTNAQTASYVADTGVINLAPGQSLRISAAGVGSERAAVQFKKTEYVDSGIIGGVVRQQVASQTTTGPIDLSGDQCLVFFLGGTGSSVRVQIYGNSPYLKPNAFMIISAGTNTGSAPVVEEISLTYRKVELENY